MLVGARQRIPPGGPSPAREEICCARQTDSRYFNRLSHCSKKTQPRVCRRCRPPKQTADAAQDMQSTTGAEAPPRAPEQHIQSATTGVLPPLRLPENRNAASQHPARIPQHQPAIRNLRPIPSAAHEKRCQPLIESRDDFCAPAGFGHPKRCTSLLTTAPGSVDH